MSCVCQQAWLEKSVCWDCCQPWPRQHCTRGTSTLGMSLAYGSGPHRNHGYILAHIRIQGIDCQRLRGAVCATCGVMIAFDDYIYCTCAYPRMRPSQSCHQMESGTQCNQFTQHAPVLAYLQCDPQLGSEFKDRVSVSSLKWSNGVRAPITG
jgi:hypothetical protein